MANIERLTRLAEWLEADAPQTCGIRGFNMETYFRIDDDSAYHDLYQAWILHRDNVEVTKPLFNECGAVCCIAGAAIACWGDPAEAIVQKSFMESAQRLLGLTSNQAQDLFVPNIPIGDDDREKYDLSDEWYALPLRLISPAHAARTIRHLIATGAVDWEFTRHE